MGKFLIITTILAILIPMMIFVSSCSERAQNNVDEGHATMYIIRNDDDIRIVTRYNENFDLINRFRKMGGNNVFNISSPMLVARGENLSDVQLANAAHINGADLGESDWFGPYIVQAIDNIDGTSPQSMHFTGGNHEYTNSGYGGTPTARTDNIQMRINGQLITNDFRGYADNIEISWSNYIQATNTKKADGSGREVMREDYIVTINKQSPGGLAMMSDGMAMEIEHRIEFFEDVQIVTYYGLQAVHNAWAGEVQFEYGNTDDGIFQTQWQDVYRKQVGTREPNGSAVFLRNNNHALIMNLDLTWGIGDRRYLNERPLTEFSRYSIFTAGWNKTYFNLINHQEFSAGTIDGWRGSIQFRYWPPFVELGE